MEIDVFDFDKTVYTGDSSIDFWLFALRRHPLIAFLVPFQLLGLLLYRLGLLPLETHKQWFFSFMRFIPGEQAVEAFWVNCADKLDARFFGETLTRTSLVVSGSPDFLVRPACRLCGYSDVIATEIDIKTGKLLGSNCKKEEKLVRIGQKYPGAVINRVFTDSVKNDAFLLKSAKEGYFVRNGEITLLRDVDYTYFEGGMINRLKAVFLLLRPRQYVKNLLIFLALFFSGVLRNPDSAHLTLNAVYAFIIFCVCSSGVYIINDIFDAKADKLHPYKKYRPITAGRISVNSGYALALALMLVSIIWSYFLNVTCFVIILIYITLNLLYSSRLKRVPLVDVVIVSLGFVLRTFMGGYAIYEQISPFMILTVTAGALFMAFGKRKNEHRDIIEGDTRHVLRRYPQTFLDQATISMMVLTITFYTLWTISYLSTRNPVSVRMVYTTPVFILILLRYSMLLEGSSSGDPVDVITRDWMILSLVFILAALVTMFMYL